MATRHGIGRRIALRLIAVAGFAAAAWALGSAAAHAAPTESTASQLATTEATAPIEATAAQPAPIEATALDHILGTVLGTVLGAPDADVVDTRPVPIKQIRKPSSRPRMHVAEPRTGDPLTRVVINPLLDTVVSVTEPVLRIAEPVLRIAEPVLRVAEPVLRVAVEPIAVLAEPLLRAVEPVVGLVEPIAAPVVAAPIQRVIALIHEFAQPTGGARVGSGPIRAVPHRAHHGMVHALPVQQMRHSMPVRHLPGPPGGRTQMNVQAAAQAPDGDRDVVLRDGARRAAERRGGDRPTSSPD